MSVPEPNLPDTATVDSDMRGWLERAAKKHCCPNPQEHGVQGHCCAFLLAHTEVGVLWGRVDGGALVTASEAFKGDEKSRPLLRADLTSALLWQARLFSPKAEVLLWRDGETWRARALDDTGVPEGDIIDEEQMLWGTTAEARAGGFTLLADGREGLRHAVPIDVPQSAFGSGNNRRPVRLLVRHHIDYDEDGNARIARSRLCDLTK